VLPASAGEELPAAAAAASSALLLQQPTPAEDMWHFGLCVLEMITRRYSERGARAHASRVKRRTRSRLLCALRACAGRLSHLAEHGQMP
jgi:hypothetical protein